MRKIINRRAFLRTAGSVSALTASASAVTLAAASEHPDAKLLAMCAKFERVFAAWKAAAARHDEAYAPIAAALGPAPVHSPHYPEWLERHRTECERSGVDASGEACDAAYALVYDLALVMIDTPAATIEGLAVKAQALRFDLAMEGNGEPRPSWDYDKETTFAFLCEIERMAQAGRA